MTSPLPDPASPAVPAHVTCLVAGGGPAGMMVGYLLARTGVDVWVVEKHADFLRDFRGDTVHPSTLAVMDELGLLEAFLERPHSELHRIDILFGATRLHLADLDRLPAPRQFVAIMPQWDFLNFLAERGRQFPTFHVAMRTAVRDLLIEDGRVSGVRLDTPSGPRDVEATLVIGADGRSSIVREKAGLHVEDIGAPMDVLWMRLSRKASDDAELLGRVAPGAMFVTIDRREYWQCAYVIPKGGHDALVARGLDAFRAGIAAIAPSLADRVSEIASWDQVKLLTVKVDRLDRWYRPGLLCIGDAAHAMSPVGGIGINLAIQDAVAAANVLAVPLRDRRLTTVDLAAVEARRAWPTRVTQRAQVIVQNAVIAPALAAGGRPVHPPLFMRVVSRVPALRRLAARLIGLGVRPEHVRSPSLAPSNPSRTS